MILLRDNSEHAGGMPSYFTLNSVHSAGNPGGSWSSDKSVALAFAREQDAKEFISMYLRGYMHNVVLEAVNVG